jgi:hypothetical protein
MQKDVLLRSQAAGKYLARQGKSEQNRRICFRAKREHLKKVEGLSTESQG